MTGSMGDGNRDCQSHPYSPIFTRIRPYSPVFTTLTTFGAQHNVGDVSGLRRTETFSTDDRRLSGVWTRPHIHQKRCCWLECRRRRTEEPKKKQRRNKEETKKKQRMGRRPCSLERGHRPVPRTAPNTGWGDDGTPSFLSTYLKVSSQIESYRCVIGILLCIGGERRSFPRYIVNERTTGI